MVEKILASKFIKYIIQFAILYGLIFVVELSSNKKVPKALRTVITIVIGFFYVISIATTGAYTIFGTGEAVWKRVMTGLITIVLVWFLYKIVKKYWKSIK
ncbi:hypothetical protein [Mediannikoviicoccus vaginalis]|uniref:hypothetical protein n=1 Tax=Mediannikoviicoccus vaginalis TaxID=2899727 RepID=UPI001F2E9ADF|nr:hypothetical protein [Mediannikoviicoccus vaginalis]